MSTLNENFPAYTNPNKYLFVKVGPSTVKISFDEIKYIEGLKDYIKIYVDKKSIVTKCTI